jgi:hypothetical protein
VSSSARVCVAAFILVAASCPAKSPPAQPDAACTGEGCPVVELDGGGGDASGPTTCEGVSCNTPPARVCVDAQTLRIYDATGSCSDGQCSYASRTESCAGGCTNGACVNNPCQGVTCNLPPAAHCIDANTLAVPSPTGSCSGGSCHYAESFTTCQYGCATDACVNDPCAGKTCNTPPAKYCLSPTTLRTFQTAGVCSGGSCLYTPTDETCAFGCSGGACNNDPCAGVTCNMPPARTCVGGAARVYSPSGTCASGTCNYSYTDTPCDNGCENGVCNPPACGGVTCNTPPASTCTTANRLRSSMPTASRSTSGAPRGR